MYTFVCELPREQKLELIRSVEGYTVKKNVLCEKILNLYEMEVCSYEKMIQLRVDNRNNIM